MSLTSAAGRLTAVLGPTNTGKTYLAIERMLGHESGMIGFPLRLLARENYDKVVRLKGEGAAALITGEEKIVPADPRYFICTVESMPVDRRVSGGGFPASTCTSSEGGPGPRAPLIPAPCAPCGVGPSGLSFWKPGAATPGR